MEKHVSVFIKALTAAKLAADFAGEKVFQHITSMKYASTFLKVWALCAVMSAGKFMID